MGIYIPDTFSSVGDAVVTGAAGFAYLNDVSNPIAFGLSFRKLVSSYSGPCFQLVRASDNATLDIGFVNNVVDTAAIAAFCGASDGHGLIWYDQGPSGINMVNISIATGAPKIYDGATATVFTDNGEVAWNFESGDYLVDTGGTSDFNYLINGTSSNIAAVARPGNNNNPGVEYWLLANNGSGANQTGIRIRYSDGGADNNVHQVTISNASVNNAFISQQNIWEANKQQMIFISLDADLSPVTNRVKSQINQTFVFGTNTATAAAPTGPATANMYIGRLSTGGNWVGSIQEIVFWDTDVTANKLNIQANINNYYNLWVSYIYQLDEFDASGTWTKPANSVMHEVVVIAAGGGGASGSKQPSGTASQAGSGGGFGAVSWTHFLSSSLGATEAVTIGAGGLGGASLTDGNNNTNGQTGSSGGNTSFGSHVGIAGSTGGAYNAPAGTVTWSGVGNTPSNNPFIWNRTGGVGSMGSSPTGSAGTNGDSQSINANFLLPRTPSGGGVQAGGGATAGGAGTRILNNMTFQQLNVAAIGGSANNGFPGNGGLSNIGVYVGSGPIMWQTSNVGTMQYGASGGGGGGSATGNAGRGGDPGLYGSGGAGGGASQNGPGRDSGRGGHGAQGCVKILSIIIPS